jgi:hypothetical protein
MQVVVAVELLQEVLLVPEEQAAEAQQEPRQQ